MTADPTIKDLADATGAGTDVVAYLEAKGITRPATLALVAKDETAFEKFVIQPWLDGFEKEGKPCTVSAHGLPHLAPPCRSTSRQSSASQPGPLGSGRFC